MHEETSEGIVLRSINYKERERIITVFTKDTGIISLIVKRISQKSSHLLSLTTPFCQAEYVYVRGKSDLFRFHDGTTLDEHLSLRLRLSSIDSAAALSQAILHSQLPGKSSPGLYELLDRFLKQIPHFEDPSQLTCSFYLKMLQHEGLIAIDFPQTTLFSPSEWTLAKELLLCRSFSSLKEKILPFDFSKKIEQYFKERIQG